MNNIKENVEDKIIDWIALGSEGRLVAFINEKSGELVVQKKGGYGEKEMVFKLEIFATPAESRDFNKDIVLPILKSKNNFYLAVVVFDEIKQIVEEKFWLVPYSELVKMPRPIKFETNKFIKYLTNKQDFVIFLVNKLISENKPSPKIGFRKRVY